MDAKSDGVQLLVLVMPRILSHSSMREVCSDSCLHLGHSLTLCMLQSMATACMDKVRVAGLTAMTTAFA